MPSTIREELADYTIASSSMKKFVPTHRQPQIRRQKPTDTGDTEVYQCTNQSGQTTPIIRRDIPGLPGVIVFARLSLSGLFYVTFDGEANTITPEVLGCLSVLWELFDRIDGTLVDLSITSIGGFLAADLGCLVGGDEFSSLRRKLSCSRQALHGLLMALHS